MTTVRQAEGSPSHHHARERRRFTADEYLRMIDAGVLRDEDRVELVEGEILIVSPQGPEHTSHKDEHADRLRRAYAPQDVYVRDQGPLHCGPHAIPEPDLAVVKGRPRDYRAAHPRGTDALLVVEVAKTSQARDRHKAADYARGGVPVYWLLDLEARTLDVYTDPDPAAGRFRARVTLQAGDSVAVPSTAHTWDVASLFA